MTIIPTGRRLCSVFCLLLALTAARAEDFRAKTVAAIQYDPPKQPIDSRDLQRMQLVQQGQPLDPKQVAGTIDRLFSTGLYEDIQVDASAAANGITLRFITRPRRFIGHVGAEGDISDPPS